ncbi:uncharacterized protein LOC127851090 [Dreissena polymorpha]|uniref:THD domain-containing protein n=1 Tax=Dreissena polymorpha TaxID=45954 RepID=A0A9D4I2K2_DREPO|nr:uncharacterized protein LOC127851090 [Dreissena polymorpha]XP_052240549.1 uncharacterized protein LOC127851090 [Dreissena polymorpha]KAH3740126.1 hypothetical protein DPMN_046821 [Dreissena polymorpha]
MGRSSLLILKIATIVQAVVLLAITITWERKRHDNTANIVAKMCSECTDLLPRGVMIEDKIPENVESLISEENSTICCGDVKQMLELAVMKTALEKLYEQKIGTLPEVSVKVPCQPQDPPDIPQGRIAGVVGFLPTQWPGFHRLVWNKNNHTRISGGLQHLDLDGELFIRKAGTYFVSISLNLVSNASFLGPLHEYVTIRMSVLSHQLGYTRVVLENRSRPWDEKTLNKPVHFGAIFNFHEYDRLSLSISHPSLIALNSFIDQFIVIFQFS